MMDPLAERYAQEHKRFLEENNPPVLSGQSDPGSYLAAVGRQAADRYEHLMFQHLNSPAVRDLPHREKVQELETRRYEIEEMIRDEIIFQPRRD